MTLDQLQIFKAIAEQGGLHAASKVLNRTQPTLSTGIKNLEAELGVELLNRSGYRVSLTPAGETLLTKAKEILTQVENFQALAKELTMGIEPVIKIAIDYLAPLDIVLPLIANFQNKLDTTQIELNFEVLSGAEAKLDSNQVNLAITPFVASEQDKEITRLCEVKIIPVISTKLIKANSKKLDLTKLPQIIVKSSGKSDSIPPSQIASTQKVWTVSDHLIKKELIISGFGWGHLETTSITNELNKKILKELKTKSLGPKKLPLYLVRSKKQPFGPVAQKLWEQLAQDLLRL